MCYNITIPLLLDIKVALFIYFSFVAVLGFELRASWVVRITGVSHQCPACAQFFFFKELLDCSPKWLHYCTFPLTPQFSTVSSMVLSVSILDSTILLGAKWYLSVGFVLFGLMVFCFVWSLNSGPHALYHVSHSTSSLLCWIFSR
jgi:hypothetical protein